MGEIFKPYQEVVKLRHENIYPKGQDDPGNQHPDKQSSIIPYILFRIINIFENFLDEINTNILCLVTFFLL